NEKHNQANNEDNRDGESHNRSWNCGVEGPTGDPAVLALRGLQMRNFLATLFLSQGVPMLLAGDELGRTQGGNDNAYCPDNEVSWIDWDGVDEGLAAFTRQLIRLRREHPVFRRRRWLVGHPANGHDQPEVGWFGADGQPMTDERWQDSSTKVLAVCL